MKNITITVSDEIYHPARVYAAQQDLTLSALVRHFLTGLHLRQSPPHDASDLYLAAFYSTPTHPLQEL